MGGTIRGVIALTGPLQGKPSAIARATVWRWR